MEMKLPRTPRWLKLSFLVALGIALTGWLVWFFFSSQITSFFKSRFVSLPKIELAEEGFPVKVIYPAIEVVSDIPGLKVEKADMTKFNELLKEWGVFGQNKMFLYVLQEINPNDISKTFITPKKIILHLTDKEQRYNQAWRLSQVLGETNEKENQKKELVEAVGEVWDSDLKTLELNLFSINFSKDKNEPLEYLNQSFNRLVLKSLYDRTHINEKDHPARLIEVDILAGKLFTEGNLSFRVIK